MDLRRNRANTPRQPHAIASGRPPNPSHDNENVGRMGGVSEILTIFATNYNPEAFERPNGRSQAGPSSDMDEKTEDKTQQL